MKNQKCSICKTKLKKSSFEFTNAYLIQMSECLMYDEKEKTGTIGKKIFEMLKGWNK